ncbi:MAG: hemolysin family protein [Verrucomicrobiota bacterium]
MFLLVLYVSVALGFSFLCSLLEATLLTITPTQLQAAESAGKRWADKLKGLKQDIDQPLSAILTLNTIAHTMGATGAGAQYARIYGDATGGIFAGVLTLAVLVLTEIIPKTLGARYTLFFAPFTAWFLPFLEKILRPVVWFCQSITRLITFGGASDRPRYREELLAVARLGVEDRSVKANESRIVRNMLSLNQLNTSSIMTPRPVVFMLPESLHLSGFADVIEDQPFSRIPLHNEDSEQITGFVLRSEVLLACLKTPDQTLGDLKRPILFVPESMKVDALFQRLIQEQAHVAIVQSEYGSSMGLVTLEDVVETLVGVEIMDEQDTVADLQVHARELWEKRLEQLKGKPANPKKE